MLAAPALIGVGDNKMVGINIKKYLTLACFILLLLVLTGCSDGCSNSDDSSSVQVSSGTAQPSDTVSQHVDNGVVSQYVDNDTDVADDIFGESAGASNAAHANSNQAVSDQTNGNTGSGAAASSGSNNAGSNPAGSSSKAGTNAGSSTGNPDLPAGASSIREWTGRY